LAELQAAALVNQPGRFAVILEQHHFRGRQLAGGNGVAIIWVFRQAKLQLRTQRRQDGSDIIRCKMALEIEPISRRTIQHGNQQHES